MDNKTNRKCSKCKEEMYIDYSKYVDSTVWICKSCGHEVLICNNSN